MTIENFNKFYDEYQRFSAYVAYCITKDKLLAEDISQEIFITLYKMRENLDYSDHKKLKALVFRATTNRCNDYFRKPSTKQEMCTFDEEGVEETPDEKRRPGSTASAHGRRNLSATRSPETQNEKSTELRYFDKNQDAQDSGLGSC